MNRRAAFWIFIVFVVLALILALLAAFYRISEAPDSHPAGDSNAGETSHQASKYIFYQSPFYFSFETRATSMAALYPFTQDFRLAGRNNSQGFRTHEYTFARPPDTFRIVVLGDALTWGAGVSMEETFSHVLGGLLNRDCVRFRYEVVALGVPGHRLADDLITLVVHGQYLKPDLVIVQIRPEDVEFFSYGAILRRQGKENDTAAFVASLRAALGEGSLDRRVFSEALQEMKKWSLLHSVPICFLIFPAIDSNKDGRNFNHYDPMLFPLNPRLGMFQNVVDEVRNEGFKTSFLLETFRNQAGNSYLAVSETSNLLNAAGHLLVAQSLFSFLSQSKLTRCGDYQIKPADPEWKEEMRLRSEAEADWLKFSTSYPSQLKLYEALSKLYPENPWIISQLSDVYYSLHRTQEAYSGYESLSKIVTEYTVPWYHMALCETNRKLRFELLKKMLQIVPDHTPSMVALSRLYLEDSRPADACKIPQRLMEIPATQEQYDMGKELYQKNHCDRYLPNESK